MEPDFTGLDIHFNSDEARPPYISEIFNYQNDGKEGILDHDGCPAVGL